jgi:methylmalonyl-CoA mutase N-terminal domain/subunit
MVAYRLHEAKKRWHENVVRKTLERAPERKQQFTTSSNIPLDTVYTPDDARDSAGGLRGGDWLPGEYRSRAVSSRPCTVAASDDASMQAMPPPKNNARYRFLLDRTKRLVRRLDSTQFTDADDPMAVGEVGKVGVCISSIHAWRGCLKASRSIRYLPA